MRIWGPEWKTYQRKSDQDGHFESKLGCLGRSWLQVGLSWAILAASWAVLGDVGNKMERNGAIRSAKRSRQRLPDGKYRPPPVVFDPGLGSLVPTILRLQDPKILRFEYPKIRKPLSSLKTPLILRYNFEAPLTLCSSSSASQPGGPEGAGGFFPKL